jgi:hypothetical protein
MARLRLFCRLRGIELPYKLDHEFGKRAHGLSEAIQRVTSSSRADVIVLLSDLEGVLEDPDGTVKSLARARRAGQQVVCVTPFGPSFAPSPRTDTGKMVADALTIDERERLTLARRLLVRQGITVLDAGPDDTVPQLLGRISRARSAMRRLA